MRKKKGIILVYLIIFVAIVYWIFIFHSSASLRKAEEVDIDGSGEDTAQSGQQWRVMHGGAKPIFKNLDSLADVFGSQHLNVDELNVRKKNNENSTFAGVFRKGDTARAPGRGSKPRGFMSDADAMGLTFYKRQFYLNGKPFRIFSGSIHYFRVVPEAWRDRLLKLKACGLNTVETYVPWNLHEPRPGVYNFEGMLDLRLFLKTAAELGLYVILRPGPYICSEIDFGGMPGLFLKTAAELGLYVILRPGPYICSEIDFGGMPGWLLSDPKMKVRSNYNGYMKAVIRYFNLLLLKFVDLQFTEGGPIIMVQVENEYATYGENIDHLKLLTHILRSGGIKELLVTSDNNYDRTEMYFHDYALPTSNAATFKIEHYEAITSLNQHFPFMIMELWTGWFTSWGQLYKGGRSIASVNETIQRMLDIGGSFNLYMFHGGTNFGFTSGANNHSKYSSYVTSYDYDALLTESGDITAKYMAVRNIMLQFYKSIGIKSLPPIPADTPRKAYGRLMIEEAIDWKSFIHMIPSATTSKTTRHMESYSKHNPTLGYIVYSYRNVERKWKEHAWLQIIGYIRDRVLGILCNQLFAVVHGANSEVDPSLDYDWNLLFTADHYDYYWDRREYYDQVLEHHDWKPLMAKEIKRIMKKKAEKSYLADAELHLMVENLGRVGYSTRERNLFNGQRKGLQGPVFNFMWGKTVDNWNVRYLTLDPDQCFQFSNSTLWTKMELGLTGSNPAIDLVPGTDPGPTAETYNNDNNNNDDDDVVDDDDGTVRGGRKKGEYRLKAPALFRTHLYLHEEPQDTFIHLQGWTKGVVMVNGFNLGRYWKIGPQTSLYLPGPLLHRGNNEILIFEEETRGDSILLSAQHFVGIYAPI